MTQWDFWGGPAVETSPSSEVGASSVPSWEAGILHALSPRSQGIEMESVL